MNVWKLKLSLFLNFLVLAILLNSVGAVILQAQRTYGVSESSASMLAAFKGLGIVAASLLTVSHLVLIGYRRAMLWPLAGLTVLCLILPSLPNFLMIKLLFVAVGVGYAVIKVSVYATIGLVTADRKEHASFMSFLEAVFTAGIILGYGLFSAFADDLNPRSPGWLRVFYPIAALAFLAFLLLLGSELDDSAAREEARRPWREVGAGLVRLAGTDIVLIFGVCIFLYVMVEQGTLNWLPTFNHNVLHLLTTTSIRMAGLFTAAMALGRFIAGIVLRRISWFPVLAACLVGAAGLVLVALSLGGNAAATSDRTGAHAPLAAFLLPMIGLLIAPIYPAINSAMLTALPVQKQGAISALGVIFSALGSALGTMLLGYVFQFYGGSSAFYFSVIPIGALLVGLFFFRRQFKPA